MLGALYLCSMYTITRELVDLLLEYENYVINANCIIVIVKQQHTLTKLYPQSHSLILHVYLAVLLQFSVRT